MILILGGTTEGRIAVRILEEAGKLFYYSTKGDEQEIILHNGIRLQGAMEAEAAVTFCEEHGIRLLIDAAHPFAEQLHKTVERVSEETGIPVIRFERVFPDRDQVHVTWCGDYEEAIRRIEKEKLSRLLVLTGVQSISKLERLRREGIRCYFRILDRDSSRELARKQGCPEEDICYYRAGEEERNLMRRLRPEAILTKESGVSGGFLEKVEAARELGIRVFAIRRPPTPESFLTVNGGHGLRRMLENLLPDFFPLRSGLTTGTCAAAAAVAATWDIFHVGGEGRPTAFEVTLPDGETIPVPVEPRTEQLCEGLTDSRSGMFEACASVIKDAGDDPDITHGMRIVTRVSIPFLRDGETVGRDGNTAAGEAVSEGEPPVLIRGGEGVGTVTLPGLGMEPGSPAINATPLRMIGENVRRCLRQCGGAGRVGTVVVTVSVPGGEEAAKRTFNPRLGIEGGISIIGTSGIVKPFSSEAFVNSIRKSVEVARATGSPRMVISSGAKSERYIKSRYPDLPAQAFVHYGNFIGETLKIAAELGIPRVTLGVMMGKAVKLAEGKLDTHSKKGTMNKSFILDIARQAGCSGETLARMEEMNLARELWDILPLHERGTFCHLLTGNCLRHCAPLLPEGELTLLLITENGEIHV